MRNLTLFCALLLLAGAALAACGNRADITPPPGQMQDSDSY